MVDRILRIGTGNSYFLFGPRGSGKTTMLRQLFHEPQAWYIDLLDPDTEARYTMRPADLERDLLAREPAVRTVVIDEVQKAPKLLDVVQRLMGLRPNLQFVLTGSSARKLRRGASNMLAGRAIVHHLHPLTATELGPAFDLDSALHWGTLPAITTIADVQNKAGFLRAYAQTYLREEIVVEQLVRNLPPFRRFLEVAAQSSGRIVNYSRIAADVQTETSTVQSYFSVLEDTLVGIMLPAYHTSVRKQQRQSPKFYFFDTGVRRALERTVGNELVAGTYAYGDAFEHFVVLECHRLCSYRQPDWALSYLRSNHGAEVDLVIDRPGKPTALVEIKSTERICDRDVSAGNRYAADMPNTEAFCLSRDPHPVTIGRTRCLPWRDGLTELGLTA